MRPILWHMLYRSGLPYVFQRAQDNKLTIVLYHGVDEERDLGSYNHRGKFLSPEAFEEQLRYYKRRYSVMPLDEAVQALIGGKKLPTRALTITFDDGYRNNYTHAFPLLKKYGVPATVFITTDFVFRKKPLWVDRLEYAINNSSRFTSTQEKIAFDNVERERLKGLPVDMRLEALESLEKELSSTFNDFAGARVVYTPLTVEEMSEMKKHGIMFGAHTKSHPILSTLTKDGAYAEVEGSLQELQEHVGEVSLVFAYPNGQTKDVREETQEVVQHIGFHSALTTVPGVNGPKANRYMLHRYSLDNCNLFSRFVVTVSGTKRLLTLMYNYAQRS